MSGYHHGNLRAALVVAGTDLAREHGPAGVVLREAARRVGVSHNAAYRHFADREALLAEISVVGMQRLTAAMQDAVRDALAALPPEADEVRRARTRLAATGQAYVDFALAEPGLFRVAFATALPGQPQAGDAASGQPETPAASPDTDPYAVLTGSLDALAACGYLPPERRAAAETVCWAAVHGFAVLHLDGPLRDVPPEEREAELWRLLVAVDLGLSAHGDDAGATLEVRGAGAVPAS